MIRKGGGNESVSPTEELLPLQIQDPVLDLLKEGPVSEEDVKELAGEEISESLGRGLDGLRRHSVEFQPVFLSDNNGNVYINRSCPPGDKGACSSTYDAPPGYRILLRSHPHPGGTKGGIGYTYPYLSIDDYFNLLLPSRLLDGEELAMAIVSLDQTSIAIVTEETQRIISSLVESLPSRPMSQAGKDRASLELIADEFEKARGSLEISNDPQARLKLNKAICKAMGIVHLDIGAGSRKIRFLE